MTGTMWERIARAVGIAALAAAVAMPVSAQQTGSITGQATDADTGQPLPGVQVVIVGRSIGTVTNQRGQYLLAGVPAGEVTLQARRLGYAEQSRTLTVTAGAAATAHFSIQQQAVQLAEIVATATGDRRRVEVGNAVSQVNADALLNTRPIANMSDMLVTRAPGVQVLPGSMTGTQARVRIRGSSSLSLSNDPIYIIDGVRMQSSSNSSSIGIGGQLPGRVGDLNPDEIESIEVVKGPSAATLYGTDAANGVIVIRTKRGKAGAPHWTAYTEQGIIEDRNEHPVAYRAWQSERKPGFTPTTASGGSQCFLNDLARGACKQDSITSYSLYADPRATPHGTGRRQQYGLQVSGGSEALRYFVSGEWEDEIGLFKMPQFEVERLNRKGVQIREEWMRPNALNRVSGRANLNVNLAKNADLAINTNYIHLNQRLPQHENNATGLGSNATGGPGTRFNTNAAGDTLYGYRAYAPGDIFQETVTQGVDRFLGSVTGSWKPLPWLTARGNTGVDYTARVDQDICRRDNCVDFGTHRQGFKRDNRTNLYVYTLDGSASAEFRPLSWAQTRTTVGAQFYRDIFDRNGAYGQNLPPGATQITAAAVHTANEFTDESRTFGMFVEQNVSLHERLFLTGALRSDRNSAFGADFGTALYPKASLSYLLSEERWFPRGEAVNELRFRAAYGASGVQPGATDAVQYFGATQARLENQELPGVVFSALGNRHLRPERSAELEVGLDGTFLNNRVNAELTFYDKRSKDALIARILPPSIGTQLTSRFENLGEVRNWGYEGLVTAQLIESQPFDWAVTLNGSTNANRLVSLGDVPPIIGATIRQIQGFPINGWWQRPIKSYADTNGDGVIGVNEVVVGDTAEFLGYSIPRHEVAFTNEFGFAGNRVRLITQFDYKGGYKQLYGTERIRCQNRGNCRGALDPNAPLWEQARATALRNASLGNTQAGYVEDASFIRFRELGLNVTAPDAWAKRFGGARALSATVSARNLKLWTDYSGADPEGGYGGDVRSDFQTQPPPSYLTLRVNVGF